MNLRVFTRIYGVGRRSFGDGLESEGDVIVQIRYSAQKVLQMLVS